MGTLSTHLEVNYTADLSTGPSHITNSNYAITIPRDADITEYSPKTLKPNLNDFSNAASRFDIESIQTFIYLQANRRMRLLLKTANGAGEVELDADRIFYVVAPFSRVSIINRDLVNSLLVKIVYS
jgi:hypothetical protein